MKATAILTALLCVLLAGCSLRKPAKAAAPPPAPPPVVAPPPAPPAALSTPQTHVALPAPQSLDPASLVVEAPPAEPAPAPEPPPRPRRTGPAPSQPVAPPVAAPPPEREPVQEIMSSAESKRLQEEAAARRREAKRILDQVTRRHLNPAQKDVALSIGNFVALSEEAQNRNDLRQAFALAEKALILAKELQSGK